MLWKWHMTHLKNARNKIRSHATLSRSVYKMSANLLDLWTIGSKRKPDSSKEEHPKSEKVKKYEESRIWKFQPTWNKEFSWVKFDVEKNEMFCTVCCKYPTVANKASQLYVGINGLPPLVFAVILSWVTRRAILITFVFNELKTKKNQSRHRYSE